MAKVFAFDPADYREQYTREGWVHIKDGVTPEFLALLKDYAAKELEAARLDRHRIAGKKEQSLFEFPGSVEYPGELFDVVASLCGLNRATMTLSERHIQAYEPDAAPEPLAHKDRYASQVSVGFSINIPAESRLVLFPYEERGINPFNVSAQFLNSLQPHEHPGVVAKTAREIELDDEDGDVVMFPGSTTWHFRRNSANAVNLYCKFNDFGCDPLGEDPTTAARRQRTEALLAGDALNGAIPVKARRLDLVTCSYTRDWEEVRQTNVYGEAPFGLSESQFRIMQIADGRMGIGDLGAKAGIDVGQAAADVRILAERGALDLN